MDDGQSFAKKEYPPLLWQVEALPEFARTLKQYQKKHRDAVAQLLVNLEAMHEALNLGVKPASLQSGHIHHEPQGILAVDQRGGPGKTIELRLYTYPCEGSSTLHLLMIGDKGSQSRDIAWCSGVVRNLRKERADGQA